MLVKIKTVIEKNYFAPLVPNTMHIHAAVKYADFVSVPLRLG